MGLTLDPPQVKIWAPPHILKNFRAGCVHSFTHHLPSHYLVEIEKVGKCFLSFLLQMLSYFFIITKIVKYHSPH